MKDLNSKGWAAFVLCAVLSPLGVAFGAAMFARAPSRRERDIGIFLWVASLLTLLAWLSLFEVFK